MQISGITLRQQRLKAGLSQARFAELCGVSQHLLSAFELGKAELPSSAISGVREALDNVEAIEKLASRAKRYRLHEYKEATVLPERSARAALTVGNADYKSDLMHLAKEHLQSEERQLSAVSLFSGCGGFSLGFSAAGFKMKGFLELEEDLRKIYRVNFPESLEIGGDITEVDDAQLIRWVEEIGHVDAIIGGPPCQGFSLSGKRKVDDPRNSLFRHYLRFVKQFKPKIALLENVRLLTSMRSESGSYVRDDISAAFEEIGYVVNHFDVNSIQYGVPQHRERVIFVAVRSDLRIPPSIPSPSHGVGGGLFDSLSPVRTFGDACSDLEFIESGQRGLDPLHEAVNHPTHVINWLWDVQEGRSAHDNADPSLRPPSGYNTTYKRQVWNEPGATVQTTFGMISGCRNVHPIATRSLTIREAARLQSFPDTYQFQGTLGSIRKGVGNAVPPLMALALGKHVKEIIHNL